MVRIHLPPAASPVRTDFHFRARLPQDAAPRSAWPGPANLTTAVRGQDQEHLQFLLHDSCRHVDAFDPCENAGHQIACS
jgi:hypothetical protein